MFEGDWVVGLEVLVKVCAGVFIDSVIVCCYCDVCFVVGVLGSYGAVVFFFYIFVDRQVVVSIVGE